MQSLGIDVLFKGTNFLRLLGGLWVALRISLISVAISIVLGIAMGMLMTSKSRVLKAIFRVYLEIVRIMPQMVLLFVVYFRPGSSAGIWKRKRRPSSCSASGVRRKWAIWCGARCKASPSFSGRALRRWA